MDLKDVKVLIERIDIHYNTELSKKDGLLKEWDKYLKKYDKKDVFRKLDEYIKDYIDYPPKLYNLIRDLKTTEEKHKLKNLYTMCNYCGEKVNMEEFEHHHSKCLMIEYIEKNVKKYLDKQIVRSDYLEMKKDELIKRYEKIVQVVHKNTNNPFEKRAIEKYFETK